MKNTKAFISLCQHVTSHQEIGTIDLYAAAQKIGRQADNQPFEPGTHPMLYKIADLAFDIAENYRSKADDAADWADLTTTLHNYVQGNWEPTCWMLSAMYGEYSDETLVHSYSVSVRLQNRQIIVTTADGALKNTVEKVINALHTEQTDERFLQNLAQQLPVSITKYTLASVGVAEYLM